MVNPIPAPEPLEIKPREKRGPLEKDIERTVCAFAREKGFLTYKFTSPNRRSVPDRLLISPSGEVFFIEFKARGKKPTPGQAEEHRILREHQQLVFVIDTVESGKAVIEDMTRSWLDV